MCLGDGVRWGGVNGGEWRSRSRCREVDVCNKRSHIFIFLMI